MSRIENVPWDPETLPRATRDPERLKSDLETFGYCIIDRALEGATLRMVQERLIAQAKAERELHNMKNPANTDPVNQWVGMLLNKGDVFFELVQHPLCMSLIEHLIGKDYLISCVDAQIQHPGAGVMPLHTDQWWMPAPERPGVRPPRPADARRNTGTALNPAPATDPIAPIAAANVMWMVTDFTEENGATRVVRTAIAAEVRPTRACRTRCPRWPRPARPALPSPSMHGSGTAPHRTARPHRVTASPRSAALRCSGRSRTTCTD